MKTKARLLTILALSLFVACGNSGNGNSTISKIMQGASNSNDSGSVNGPVRGNKRSHIYHWQGCPDYDRISTEDRVEFRSAAEAEGQGYRAAQNCPKERGEQTAKSQPGVSRNTSEPSTRDTRNTAAEEKGKTAEKKSEKKRETQPTDASEGKPTVKVWVSTDSAVYHCPGSALYGKTKNGAYMTQRAALKKNIHPDGGKFCQ
ncbi:MAG: hypothetical protein M3Y84_08735 [Acidobacteriota bacterium]|nr:hypothetical protein [Acidobacteriota bacterium]